MPEIATVRVRSDWIDKMLEKHRTMTKFAERLGIETSTVSRQANGRSEASPRFIGAVMTTFAVDFEEAFDVTVEEVAQRRARIVKRPTGKRVPRMDRAAA